MSWIKVTTGLHERPEVLQMAQELGLSPWSVVGRLVAVWEWFDQNTTDSNAPSVTKTLLMSRAGCDGFVTAMQNVGWLCDDGDTIHLPNYERHNGQNAKNRAVNAVRQSRHRDKRNASTVTVRNGGGVTREEKRREELPPQPPQGGECVESGAAPGKTKRKPTPLWDCVRDTFFEGHITQSEMARASKAVAAMKAKGWTPENVIEARDAYVNKWPDRLPTIEAIVKHGAALREIGHVPQWDEVGK